MAEFESIEFEIQGNADRAAKSLLAFADALKEVSKANADGKKFSDFAASLKEIRDAVKGGSKSFSSFAKGMKELIESLQGAEASASALTNLSGAVSSLSNIGNIKISKAIGDGLRNIIQAASEITPQVFENLDRLTSYLQRLSGVDFRGFSSAFNRVNRAAQSAVVPQQAGLVPVTDVPTDSELLDGLQQHIAEQRTANIDTLKVKLEGILQNLNELRQKIKLRIDDSQARKAAKSTSALANIFNSLKRIAFYRVIRSAIKAIGAAFQEGLKNAYAFSAGLANAIDGRIAVALDGMTTKALTMKNQLGAAFGSLLTALAPIINTLIGLITSLANAITQLFAAFTGGTFLRAKDTAALFADDMKRGRGAAKEWKNQLMGFDEINRLEDPSKGGGGGGSANKLNPNDMFEVAEINSRISAFVQKIKDLVNSINFEPLINAWSKLKTAVGNFVDIVMSGLSWAWDNILVPLAHWTMEQAAPAVVNLLASAFDLLSAVLEKLSPTFQWFWEKILKPLGEWTGEVIINAIETLTKRIEDLASVVKGDKSFKEWLDTLSPLEDFLLSVATAVGTVITVMTVLSTVQGIVAAVTGGLSAALAFLAANPAVLAVAAISAIIFIGIELYKNWDKIIAKLGELQVKLRTALGDGKLDFWDFAAVAANAFMTPINAVINLIQLIVELCRWIKTAWDGLTNLPFVKRANERADAAMADGSIYLQGFASGGYPRTGQLFLANEQGPELVGTMGGHTAVASGSDIKDGIAEGVYEAVLSAMSGSSGNNQPIVINLDGKEIARTTTKYQSQMARAGAY